MCKHERYRIADARHARLLTLDSRASEPEPPRPWSRPGSDYPFSGKAGIIARLIGAEQSE